MKRKPKQTGREVLTIRHANAVITKLKKELASKAQEMEWKDKKIAELREGQSALSDGARIWVDRYRAEKERRAELMEVVQGLIAGVETLRAAVEKLTGEKVEIASVADMLGVTDE